ncbi:Uncharacterised protein [Serratia quinivorans]|uniref:hypothetical protein n=1 Tax=Serratia quinivorans TaxID=137545 RepID=UPI000F6C3E1F|nr:hypothetical protein [Serratia quinivorans]VEI70647.1 Uncharacterised protein [Serratia quinivorans]
MCTGVEIALVASAVLASGAAVAQGQQQKKMANYQAAQADADADAAKAAARVQADRIRKADGASSNNMFSNMGVS